MPIPVNGSITDRDGLQWSSKALRRALTDFKPDLIHLEEEPWSQPAAVGLRMARRLGIPAVLATAESLPRSYTLGQRFRRERSLRQAAGVIGSNNLALALAIKRRPTVPHLSLPLLGVTPPTVVPACPIPAWQSGLWVGWCRNAVSTCCFGPVLVWQASGC